MNFFTKLFRKDQNKGVIHEYVRKEETNILSGEDSDDGSFIDGCYVCEVGSKNFKGDKVYLTIVLFFNQSGLFTFQELEGHPNLANYDIDQAIDKFRNQKKIETEVGKYWMEGNKLKAIIMQPYTDEEITEEDYEGLEYRDYTNPYYEFEGKVNGRELILSMNKKTIEGELVPMLPADRFKRYL